MNTIYKCENCLEEYPSTGLPYLCPECNGIFTIEMGANLRQDMFNSKLPGIWRFKDTFGLTKTAPIVSLGEGNTVLLERSQNGHSLFFKMESHNPTLSYKDRATSVLVSMMKDRGIDHAIEDSSGNAGASFAAYSRAFSIDGSIYIPKSTSGPKKQQLDAFGANVIPIPGSRANTAKKALDAVRKGDTVYASHAFQPFGMAGIATIAYEIFEELSVSPSLIIAPIGHGNLLAGIMLGFQNLKSSGFITDMPTFIGVQTDACAPVWAKWVGENKYRPTGTTIAEGIKVETPVRGNFITSFLEKGKDSIEIINDKETITAIQDLSRMGVYVEPTSALVWAAYKKIQANQIGSVVLILTGYGLKSSVI
ncbi:MAG: pyridoxal-phosphate dependent enzyme [Anaerolineaceae bacterium]|nr:pyridoxal-phosphate dependent enzyme [Anaerolineaceae bacterium]